MRKLDNDYTVLEGNKFFVVGDLHLHYLTPKSRIDNYAQTCIDKLTKLLGYAQDNGINNIFFEGDIFHKPQQPLDFILKIMSVFNEFKSRGITCYAIIGNHDIRYERIETVWNSALGVLFEGGCLIPFRSVRFKNGNKTLAVYGTNYGLSVTPMSAIYDKDDFNICIAHKFYNFSSETTNDNLTTDDINSLGYNMYFLGHDHVTYDNLSVGDKWVIRCGSFTRNSSHTYQMKRDISFDMVSWDGTNVSLTRMALPCLPAEAVFSSSATDKPNLKDLTSDLQYSFTTLITMLNSPKAKSNGIYDILAQSDINPDVKERVCSYLYDFGILKVEDIDDE